MKKLILLLALTVLVSGNEIQITPEDTKKQGIKLIDIKNSTTSKGLPFNAMIDFDDKTSSTQSSSFEAIVVAIYKREGESVKKGDVICEISSNELSNMFFELQNTQQRYKVAKENEEKDKMLYENGVISKREYQISFLALNELQLKLDEIINKLNRVGISDTSKAGTYGFAVIANDNGILSVAPRQSGEKIEAFTPYIRITRSDNLLARIKIPVSLSGSVKKGSIITNESGNAIGEIDTVSVVIDKLSNTITATANVKAKNLKVGEIIEVYVDDKMPKNTLLVPSSAVIKDGNNYLVYQQSKNGFIPKAIKIIEEREGSFVIDATGINTDLKIADGRIITLKGMTKGF